MIKRGKRKELQKYLLLISIFTIILSNFGIVIPTEKMYAEEIESGDSIDHSVEIDASEEIENEQLTKSEPTENDAIVENESSSTSNENVQNGSQSEEGNNPVQEESEQEVQPLTTEEIDGKTEASEGEFNSFPHLLITELSPNSKGGGTDYYEFFEVYNNTNQPLSLMNYSFIYKYTDTGVEKPFQIPDVSIEPQKTLIFWFNNGDRTPQDFNNNYGLEINSDQIIEFKDVFPGFANGGNRAIVIKDNESNEIVSASYLGVENDNNGADIHYKFPAAGTEMEKYQVLAMPTPGEIESDQVPTKPVELEQIPTDTVAPTIVHTPVTEAKAFVNVKVEAIITDNIAVPNATLYYKNENEQSYTALAMNSSASDPTKYSADIPTANVQANLIYYIEANDGKNNDKTDEYLIKVNRPNIDYNKVPSFLITEVLPDTSNVGSADGYEFVEIYNNTNKAINFKDYKIQYRYGMDPATDVIWASVPDEVVIPSKETLVFWIINSQNTDKTVADFNAKFGTNLIENEDIVRIYSDGMANGSPRGLVVATNTKREIAVSYYNEEANVDDTQPDKGILYKYPEDGSTQLVKISAGEKNATPGTIEPIQVPEQLVQLEEDTINPVIENMTSITEINQKENINIVADASDNVDIKSVRLYYRMNDQTSYNEGILAENFDDMLYHYTIYSPDLIAKKYVEYYFVVSDGTNEVKSDIYKIMVQSDLNDASLRLNIKTGDVLAGEKILKGTSKSSQPDDVKLFIDGSEVDTNTYHSIENTAYFAFEVSGINTFFQNGVTMGDEILKIFDDGVTDWTTITVPIHSDQLQLGENTITVRAGNKASPFQLEESEENRDDYNLRNARLVLSDGTILRDPNHQDPSKVYDMGDDGTYRPFEDFIFTITQEHTPSKTFKWNTTAVSDGEHVVTVEDEDEKVSAIVNVDNTAPVIETNMKEGKVYKGEFTIDVDASDSIAGINTVQVFLDDQEISTRYETSSSKLASGEHTLSISATDKVGNKTEKIITFAVVNENPNKPELVSPTDGVQTIVDEDPTLKVRVTDPTEDELDVSFYQGFKYTSAQTNEVKAYKNVSDVEPPQTMEPEGEIAFTNDDITAASKVDGNYLTTDSSTQFPYHRFDVTIDSSVNENDIVELVWNGKSIEGRKVSMYAWNHQLNKWTMITYKIAGVEDFELKGNVAVNEFVKDAKINVLIQDEIPSSPEEYDYTFVWMSDTQYYSESYPHIFERQTQWIAEKRDELKIKYVFHTGDVVDEADKEYQWEYADQFMRVLEDNLVPYGVLAGNHDVDHKTNDYTAFTKWFGENRFLDKPFYGGSYKNNRGHYDLISANGNDFIMVYMGWGVQDEDLKWMNDILKQYPDRKAILNFHEYLLVSGNRSPLGNRIYNQVVLPNENVIAVLSGHYHDSETLIDTVDDNGDGNPDREIYQMLGDYQGGPEGGQGYMKLLHFDQDNNRVIVNTYSPYLNDYNFYDPASFPGKDEMVIQLDLQQQAKRVATDYFAVNIYTDTEIGRDKKVNSGDIAETDWDDLATNNTYSWYAVAKDQYTGIATSDIWTFTKGQKDDQQDPLEPEDPSEDPDSDDEFEELKDFISTNLNKLSEITNHVIEKLKQRGILKVILTDAKNESVIETGLSKEQVKSLLQKKAIISLEKEDVTVDIPAENFTNDETEAEIYIEKYQKVKGALSEVYDFTIIQGEKTINEFNTPVNLSFKIDSNDVNDPSKIKVYYYNEVSGKWELIGGTYNNGVVTAETNHFSIFTVMESDKEIVEGEKPEQQVQQEQSETREQNGQPEQSKQQPEQSKATGESIPTTATNLYNVLGIGMIFLLTGIVTMIIKRRHFM